MYYRGNIKKLISLFLLIITVGSCIEVTKGPFYGSYWKVTEINNGTFSLLDRAGHYIKNVRPSYVKETANKNCK